MIKKIEFNNSQYLSENIKELPSNCLLNKGITGCGGTTVELQSKRNSIILCPTKNLVMSKQSDNYLGVTGDTSNSEIMKYLINPNITFKKILATYNALPRLMELIPDYKEYFLLIDEYHLLFNDYQFRSEAVLYILKNFREFNKWCFMTATPLKQEFILEELKDIEQIEYQWNNATPVNITIKDTYFIIKTLTEIITTSNDKNLHIFLNSVKTIKEIVNKLNLIDCRIVCSGNNFNKITDPVKKINFYTSCAFEGCDIYDENGLCIIVSDTKISTTVLDITTKVRQVCGRLRNSIYKNEVILILNTNKHRYAGTSKEEFLRITSESENYGKAYEKTFIDATNIGKEAMIKTFVRESMATIYVNIYKDSIFYDPNLKYLDLYNYNLISEIYKTSINVLTELKNNTFIPTITKNSGIDWIIKELDPIKEYSYSELECKFKPLFEEHNLTWNKNNSLKLYFPQFTSRRKTKNGIKETYYKFNIF